MPAALLERFEQLQSGHRLRDIGDIDHVSPHVLRGARPGQPDPQIFDRDDAEDVIEGSVADREVSVNGVTGDREVFVERRVDVEPGDPRARGHKRVGAAVRQVHDAFHQFVLVLL